MGITITSIILAISAGYLHPTQIAQQVVSRVASVPPPGNYKSRSGDVYEVDPFGPTSLSVQNKTKGLCLRFWEVKGPTGQANADKLQQSLGIVRLAGQSCGNKRFGSLDWSATYRSGELKEIRLFPPGFPKDPKATPFNINYSGV